MASDTHTTAFQWDALYAKRRVLHQVCVCARVHVVCVCHVGPYCCIPIKISSVLLLMKKTHIVYSTNMQITRNVFISPSYVS